MYALKTVKAHGLPLNVLSNITRSTMLSGLTYASPAWYGFANCEDVLRLEAVAKRATRWGLLNNDITVTSICCKADQNLFTRVSSMTGHVLHSMLPPKVQLTYNLRPRRHDFTLPTTSTLLQKNFFHRMLYLLSGVGS